MAATWSKVLMIADQMINRMRPGEVLGSCSWGRAWKEKSRAKRLVCNRSQFTSANFIGCSHCDLKAHKARLYHVHSGLECVHSRNVIHRDVQALVSIAHLKFASTTSDHFLETCWTVSLVEVGSWRYLYELFWRNFSSDPLQQIWLSRATKWVKWDKNR